MGHGERVCRKCRRQGLQKALDIIISTVAPHIEDEDPDFHVLIALIAERINKEIVNNLDVQ